MAQAITHRVNTQTSYIPFLSKLIGQTVEIGQRTGDTTYVPEMNPPQSVMPVDRGVPQIYYAHNVMPTVNGFQSVGYTKWIDGISRTFGSIEYIPNTVDS